MKQLPWWVASDWEYNDSITGWLHQRRYFIGKELAKADAEYHSDGRKYQDSQIPAWFRRDFGHKWDRQDARRKLYKEFYAINAGEVMFNKTRNIDWLWW